MLVYGVGEASRLMVLRVASVMIRVWRSLMKSSPIVFAQISARQQARRMTPTMPISTQSQVRRRRTGSGNGPASDMRHSGCWRCGGGVQPDAVDSTSVTVEVTTTGSGSGAGSDRDVGVRHSGSGR